MPELLRKSRERSLRPKAKLRTLNFWSADARAVPQRQAASKWVDRYLITALFQEKRGFCE
jgi:hypothetical protein